MATRKLPKRADNGQITTIKWVQQHPDRGYLQTVKIKPRTKR